MRLLAGNGALRHLPFLHLEERLARLAMENEDESRLRHLRHRGNRLPVALHVDEHRRGGQVVVPDVVMDRLEVPAVRARAAVEGHHAVAVEVRPLAVAPVEVVGGRGQGKEDETALLVHAQERPRVRSSPVPPGVGLPGLVAGLARPGHGVEAPKHLARARVESPHVAARASGVAVAHQAARHDHVAAHRDRRGQAVLRLGKAVGHARAQVHLARLAEARVGLAGLRVHGKEPALDVAQVQESLLSVGPGRHASVHEEVPRDLLVDGGIEDPEGLVPVSASRAKSRLKGDGT